MPNPLLKTKLHIPPARQNLVARPRLIARLNECLSRPLTLISAPPGFGKTTLITSWLEQAALPTAWYSLDDSDNDLARFLTYLIAALDTVQTDLGRQARNQLHSRRPSSPESVMTLLINDIETLAHPFIFVLDDYHLIELQAIHEAMTFLIDHLPAPMHLIIATRADPPLPLPRLRARDQLVELRAPDLRFSLEEATAFLNERMGLQLSAEQVASLDTRAEGWIAGLQLAALSIQGQQNVAGFVHAFAGSHRFILDYLLEEVLEHQAPEIQDFLLQTCILDQMNALLANAVTGRTDSAQVLSQLDKANLFVVPLDDKREWYRYHHLFADLLNSRLQQTHADQISELHRRASAWYEQNGSLNEAIDHALATPDLDRAARLIELAAPMVLLRSEDRTLRTWLAALPDDMFRNHPALAIWYATALAGGGNFELAEARLVQVDDTQLDPLAHSVAALMRATIALFRSDLPHAIESARNALIAAEATTSASTDPQTEFRNIITVFLSMLLAEAEIAAGKLRDAVAIYRRELEIGADRMFANLRTIFVGYVHVRLAELYFEWNDMDAAAHHATQGLEISHAEHNEEFESYALAALAQIKQARGEYGDAIELSEQAMAISRKRNIAVEMRMLAARQVKIFLQQNRLDDAAQVAREMPVMDQGMWFMQGALTPVVRARVLLAQREFERVTKALEDLQVKLQASGEMRMLIEVLALLALARHGQGDNAQSKSLLTQALSLAEPEGYVRTFVDLGEDMRLMISDCKLQIETSRNNQHLVEYSDKLLATFPITHSRANHKSEIINLKSEMAEQLSERELAVLRLIDQGLSNQEIADRLVVAVSTVKTHINNIYSKLGAASRTQALVKAREHKLI